MAVVTQNAFRSKQALIDKARYLENRQHKRHRNVTIENIPSWNRAPQMSGFPDWVAQLRKKWKRRKHRGRPVSWGNEYTLTFPRKSFLSAAVKSDFATKAVQQLDAHSSGAGAWHNKIRKGSHDLNLAVSPFALAGVRLFPRRNRNAGEFRRLQRFTQRYLQALNKERAVQQKPAIRTVKEVQARVRQKKKRNTIAEELALCPQFKSFLAEEHHGRHHTREEWCQQITRSLQRKGNVVMDWHPRTWEAKIQRQGLFKPQNIAMRRILGEAVGLRKKQYGQNVVLPARTEQKTTSQSQVDWNDIFNALLHRSNQKTPLKNSVIFVARLKKGGLDATFNGEFNDKFLVKAKRKKPLLVLQRESLLKAQCFLLRHHLYTGFHDLPDDHRLDVESLLKDPAPPEQLCTEYHRLEETGPFWKEAQAVVANFQLRQTWLNALKSTAQIPDPVQRLVEIRRHLDDRQVRQWHQFILLVSHAADATDVIYTHFLPAMQQSPEFQGHRKHFTITKQPERAAVLEEAEPPSYSPPTK